MLQVSWQFALHPSPHFLAAWTFQPTVNLPPTYLMLHNVRTRQDEQAEMFYAAMYHLCDPDEHRS